MSANEKLNEWLKEHDARAIWATQHEDFELKGYLVQDFEIIVKSWKSQFGFRVFTPTPSSMKLTIDTLDRMIG